MPGMPGTIARHCTPTTSTVPSKKFPYCPTGCLDWVSCEFFSPSLQLLRERRLKVVPERAEEFLPDASELFEDAPVPFARPRNGVRDPPDGEVHDVLVIVVVPLIPDRQCPCKWLR